MNPTQAVRQEVTDRLVKSWGFTEAQLADLSIFHLVNILALVTGHHGYLGQFAPTMYALREALGEDNVFDKPSELRARHPAELGPADLAQTKVVVN